jgi:hypothetical protein
MIAPQQAVKRIGSSAEALSLRLEAFSRLVHDRCGDGRGVRVAPPLMDLSADVFRSRAPLGIQRAGDEHSRAGMKYRNEKRGSERLPGWNEWLFRFEPDGRPAHRGGDACVTPFDLPTQVANLNFRVDGNHVNAPVRLRSYRPLDLTECTDYFSNYDREVLETYFDGTKPSIVKTIYFAASRIAPLA